MSNKPNARMHGRVESGRLCAHPGCDLPGEFRAPVRRPGSALLPPSGPPEYQYFCLDHVREFNARWNYFDGMTPEEVYVAQSPYPMWEREARAFAHNAASGGPDRIDDALGMLKWRHASVTPSGRKLSDDERKALKVLNLDAGTTLADIKARYRELVRRFHPDSNGGDRSQEDQLRQTVEAYDLLSASKAFA